METTVLSQMSSDAKPCTNPCPGPPQPIENAGPTPSNTCGVYEIYNWIADKRYIGRSIQVRKRIQDHRRKLQRGKHANHYLQRAWDKYGEGAFDFTVLEIAHEHDLPQREGFYCTLFQTHDSEHGYNLDLVDVSGRTRLSDSHKKHIAESHTGKVRSEDFKASMRGHPVSPEARAKISMANRGKTPSDSARQAMAEAQRGRKHSEETKAKMRANGNRGRKFGPVSEERRQRMAEASRGRKHGPETLAKLSAAHKGKPKSDDHRKKMSEARKGIPRSPESIEKQRASIRETWRIRKERDDS